MLLIALALAAASCPYPDDRAVALAAKAEMPQDAVKAFGAMADRNEAYNPWDMIQPGDPPSRRFVKAQGQGCNLLLTYEYGGFVRGVAQAHLRFAEGQWSVTEDGQTVTKSSRSRARASQ